MRKVRIGHIGIGHMHSDGKMECVRRYPGLFEVVGIAEVDDIVGSSRSVYERLARFSVEDLLARDDIDAVMVECDDADLAKFGQMCVDAGKHIHLDKPAGESIPDFQRLMRTAQSKKLVVQMAYMYRYNPAVIRSLEMVKDGTLGEIFQVDAVMSTEHPRWIREWLRRFRGGTMHTFGCHLVDLLLLIQGMPERIVPYRRMTLLEGMEVYDNDFAVFEYPRGISTVRTSSFEVNGYGRRQLVIAGSEGTIELKPLETNVLSSYTHMTVATREDTRGHEYSDCNRTIPVPPITGRYDTMMIDFAAMVRGEKENPYTYEHELALQRAHLAACGFDVDLTGGAYH